MELNVKMREPNRVVLSQPNTVKTIDFTKNVGNFLANSTLKENNDIIEDDSVSNMSFARIGDVIFLTGIIVFPEENLTLEQLLPSAPVVDTEIISSTGIIYLKAESIDITAELSGTYYINGSFITNNVNSPKEV